MRLILKTIIVDEIQENVNLLTGQVGFNFAIGSYLAVMLDTLSMFVPPWQPGNCLVHTLPRKYLT